jgi:hypothetical protein
MIINYDWNHQLTPPTTPYSKASRPPWDTLYAVQAARNVIQVDRPSLNTVQPVTQAAEIGNKTVQKQLAIATPAPEAGPASRIDRPSGDTRPQLTQAVDKVRPHSSITLYAGQTAETTTKVIQKQSAAPILASEIGQPTSAYQKNAVAQVHRPAWDILYPVAQGIDSITKASPQSCDTLHPVQTETNKVVQEESALPTATIATPQPATTHQKSSATQARSAWDTLYPAAQDVEIATKASPQSRDTLYLVRAVETFAKVCQKEPALPTETLVTPQPATAHHSSVATQGRSSWDTLYPVAQNIEISTKADPQSFDALLRVGTVEIVTKAQKQYAPPIAILAAPQPPDTRQKNFATRGRPAWDTLHKVGAVEIVTKVIPKQCAVPITALATRRPVNTYQQSATTQGQPAWDTLQRVGTVEATSKVIRKQYAAPTEGDRSAWNTVYQGETVKTTTKVIRKQFAATIAVPAAPQATIPYQKSIRVQLAEAYKEDLLSGRIPDRLKKTEHAELERMIAEQYWQAPLPGTNNPPASTTTSAAPSWNSGETDYLVWAKRNLTDPAAIRLARTYGKEFESSTAPVQLYRELRKRTPPHTSFTSFSLLPYEIRQQIWEYALDTEETDVRLVWDYQMRNGHHTRTRLANASPPPRLLLVNHELRSLALKHTYERTFSTRHSAATTYFDFSKDRLFLHTSSAAELPHMLRYIRTRDAERLRSLAIPLRDLLKSNERRGLAQILCRFRNLERLDLVCGDGLEDMACGGAGDEKLAEKIQKWLASVWKIRHAPESGPEVHMYLIPAIMAHCLRIDNLMY